MRRPSAGQLAVSILLVLAVVCLIAGVVLSIVSAVKAADDPAATLGESMLMSVLSLLLYGPMMVVIGWPVTVPVVLGLGIGLAFVRQRRSRDRNPPATGRVVLVVVVGYAGLIGLTWVVLLLGARGPG